MLFCIFVPDSTSSGYLYLVDDAGNGGYVSGSPMHFPSSSSLTNNQCTVSATGSSVSVSGNTLTLTANVTFFPAFMGNKAVYVAGRDTNGNSGWHALGTWAVGGPPHVSSGPNWLTDFQNCIGPTGTAQTCVLAPGRYQVPVALPLPPDGSKVGLTIGRSNIIIAGGGGPGDTTLYRGDPSLTWIMKNSSATNVTIMNLTFDGNRYGYGINGLGISCLTDNPYIFDLDTSGGGAVTVEWADFINAPGTALLLGGAGLFGGAGSTVSVSNFGQGGTASATRATAVYVTDGTGAWYNAISYAGTAGITLAGPGQYAYGNWLTQNRYEISDSQGGGQIGLTVDSLNAQVAANVIDGKLWPSNYTCQNQPCPVCSNPPCYVNGCPAPVGQLNTGIEAYGSGHSFWNNEVWNHTGSGMQIGGSSAVYDITISSANPFDPSDLLRAIEFNAQAGINFLGPNTSQTYPIPTTGVTLDDVVVQNNAAFGVVLDGTANDNNPMHVNPVNYQGYIGYINNSCMQANAAGNTSNPAWAPNLTNRTPGPNPSNYLTLRGILNGCPLPGTPMVPAGTTVPARSHVPGWTW